MLSIRSEICRRSLTRKSENQRVRVFWIFTTYFSKSQYLAQTDFLDYMKGYIKAQLQIFKNFSCFTVLIILDFFCLMYDLYTKNVIEPIRIEIHKIFNIKITTQRFQKKDVVNYKQYKSYISNKNQKQAWCIHWSILAYIHG